MVQAGCRGMRGQRTRSTVRSMGACCKPTLAKSASGPRSVACLRQVLSVPLLSGLCWCTPVVCACLTSSLEADKISHTMATAHYGSDIKADILLSQLCHTVFCMSARYRITISWLPVHFASTHSGRLCKQTLQAQLLQSALVVNRIIVLDWLMTDLLQAVTRL